MTSYQLIGRDVGFLGATATHKPSGYSDAFHCFFPPPLLSVTSGIRTAAAAPVPYLSSHQCFEGMKAYRDADGNVRLFRPDLNIRRLNKSLARLRFPVVDEADMIELIRFGHVYYCSTRGIFIVFAPLYRCR